jgi:hypothetical protein
MAFGPTIAAAPTAGSQEAADLVVVGARIQRPNWPADTGPSSPGHRPTGSPSALGGSSRSRAANDVLAQAGRGGGWAMEHFPGGAPRKEDLDRVIPDRPVFLFNRDVHGTWVNSRTLELARCRWPTSGSNSPSPRAGSSTTPSLDLATSIDHLHSGRARPVPATSFYRDLDIMS